MPHRKEMKKWITVGWLLLSCTLFTGTVYAQNRAPAVKTVKVFGTAVIHNKNQAQARKNAVDDALSSAVGQAISSMLTSETVVQQFQLINDKILSKKENYVQKYRVLTDSVSGSRIRAFVQVEVSVDQIGKDLSVLGLARTGVVYPRVLFMVAERNRRNENFIYWWGPKKVVNRTTAESAMADTFKQSGFKIIQPPDLSSPWGLPMHPQDQQMQMIATKLGADVLVAGAATVTTASGSGGSTRTAEVSVTAKAINVKTGEVIGQSQKKETVSTQKKTQDDTSALTSAGTFVGKDLSRKVMIAWQEDRNRGTAIDVLVEGTDGHIASFVRLRQTMTSLSGVRELKMKAMSAGNAELAVNYQGNSRSLADALLLKNFVGFSIDIFDISPNSIRMRLVH